MRAVVLTVVDETLRVTAAAVLDHALAQPPLLGGGRLVCVDGLTGSGKSTLAAAITLAASARVATVHLVCSDDLLDGWNGLGAIGPRLRNYVVGPLASGHPARYRRYDWEEGGFAEEHVVAPMDLLVLEGVGTGDRSLRSRRATLVWMDIDQEVGLARAIARDGETLRVHLEEWARDEQRLSWSDLTRQRADLLVDQDGRLIS